MELTTRPGKYYDIMCYIDVEPELLEFKQNIRVLPAPFWNDKKVLFTFIKRYEPDEHKWFPNGGFYLRGPDGEFRAFDLDQVIIHPFVFEMQRQIEKNKKRLEKDRIKRDKRIARLERKAAKELKGVKKRGRKTLTEEEKLKRAEERKLNPQIQTEDGVKRRGRKSLSEEERLQREVEKAARRILSGGKKGRPSNPAKKAAREAENKAKLARNPERKRGRPKSK
jgi:hypothetical protein